MKTSEKAKVGRKMGRSWVLTPDLPFTAALAAMELDSMLRAQPSDRAAVQKLLSMLSVEGSGNGDPSNGHFPDLPTSMAFQQAFRAFSCSGGVSEEVPDDAPMPSVADAHERVISALQGVVNGQTNHDKLTSARDFCYELGRFALSYREMIFGSSAAHPYMR